jgi:hypothetical protein
MFTAASPSPPPSPGSPRPGSQQSKVGTLQGWEFQLASHSPNVAELSPRPTPVPLHNRGVCAWVDVHGHPSQQPQHLLEQQLLRLLVVSQADGIRGQSANIACLNHMPVWAAWWLPVGCGCRIKDNKLQSALISPMVASLGWKQLLKSHFLSQDGYDCANTNFPTQTQCDSVTHHQLCQGMILRNSVGSWGQHGQCLLITNR